MRWCFEFNVQRLSAVLVFFVRQPGTVADRSFIVEDKILSRTLNVEPEQKLKDAKLLILHSVCRHIRN